MLGIGRPRYPIQVSLGPSQGPPPLGKLPVFWEETPEDAPFFLRVRATDWKLQEEARPHPYSMPLTPFPQSCSRVRIPLSIQTPSCGWCWSRVTHWVTQPRSLPWESTIQAPMPKILTRLAVLGSHPLYDSSVRAFAVTCSFRVTWIASGQNEERGNGRQSPSEPKRKAWGTRASRAGMCLSSLWWQWQLFPNVCHL